MATLPRHRYTIDEYAALDEMADFKLEYFDGEIYAMAGGSVAHAQIAANIIRHVGNALAGGTCRVLTADVRLGAEASGLYTYADVSVVCGSPVLARVPQQTLLNPTVVFEVLSPSTEEYDQGGKFAHYRQIPSLAAYVLVAQDRCWVEVRVRNGPDDWAVTTLTVPDAVLSLPHPPLGLPLAAIYEQVALP